jgi:hypothetical protein
VRKAAVKVCFEDGLQPGDADEGVFGPGVSNYPPDFFLYRW